MPYGFGEGIRSQQRAANWPDSIKNIRLRKQQRLQDKRQREQEKRVELDKKEAEIQAATRTRVMARRPSIRVSGSSPSTCRAAVFSRHLAASPRVTGETMYKI